MDTKKIRKLNRISWGMIGVMIVVDTSALILQYYDIIHCLVAQGIIWSMLVVFLTTNYYIYKKVQKEIRKQWQKK